MDDAVDQWHVFVQKVVTLCSNHTGHVILLDDFNWPEIDWFTCTPPRRNSTEAKFLDVLHKIFLIQHVNMPTRTRGTDTSSILDLVISDDTVIENVNFLSPLANSDHSVLLIEGSLKPDITEGPERFNYSKGAYDNF